MIALEELKHSIRLYMQMSNGNLTEDIAKMSIKLIDILDDTTILEKEAVLNELSAFLIKRLCETLLKSCNKDYLINRFEKASSKSEYLFILADMCRDVDNNCKIYDLNGRIL